MLISTATNIDSEPVFSQFNATINTLHATFGITMTLLVVILLILVCYILFVVFGSSNSAKLGKCFRHIVYCCLYLLLTLFFFLFTAGIILASLSIQKISANDCSCRFLPLAIVPFLTMIFSIIFLLLGSCFWVLKYAMSMNSPHEHVTVQIHNTRRQLN